MSLLSRMTAPAAGHDVARLVAALLSEGAREARAALPGRAASRPSRVPTGPTGLGTSAARVTAAPDPAASGTAAPDSAASGTAASDAAVPELYCPPPLRDDPALAAEVNERLLDWAAETGIYVGRLERVRATDFGRLMMLAHPGTDDPRRLLAAARCALAEWATDDYYCDDETMGSRPEVLGSHLGLAYTAMDPTHPPLRYAQQTDQGLRADPVRVALRDSFARLAPYADRTQVTRLRQEVAALFVAYGQEGAWRAEERMPAVWEYLAHRQVNSFVPCLALIDVVDGYALTAAEYDDPRVRRAVTMAGTASTLVNDLYSMAKEQHSAGLDFNLPTVVAAEERCSPREAVERSVEIHDELVRTFEVEAAALTLTGSPALGRFLAGVWSWLGGNREWHGGSARYNDASRA
ncbi:MULTISPECIES: family 2 encapsulin nanocompartment cargo protein terpene cyclase [Streptomyces]|uniref:family 2 encapsulin nanocompartment cargo protein terpene cyclase n=1 Tax=Streptomyces TaxID=1883 RepID=UPI001EF7EE02|nr:family 2 encapsulin nanocompartment cargo protein terpene cyclase [Streptomyces aureoverticillatus]